MIFKCWYICFIDRTKKIQNELKISSHRGDAIDATTSHFTKMNTVFIKGPE